MPNSPDLPSRGLSANLHLISRASHLAAFSCASHGVAKLRRKRQTVKWSDLHSSSSALPFVEHRPVNFAFRRRSGAISQVSGRLGCHRSASLPPSQSVHSHSSSSAQSHSRVSPVDPAALHSLQYLNPRSPTHWLPDRFQQYARHWRVYRLPVADPARLRLVRKRHNPLHLSSFTSNILLIFVQAPKGSKLFV